jgi:hypothetical protein
MLDEMRMRTACFARAPQRCTSRLSKHFLLTFQEDTPLRKTRNQLIDKKGVATVKTDEGKEYHVSGKGLHPGDAVECTAHGKKWTCKKAA